MLLSHISQLFKKSSYFLTLSHTFAYFRILSHTFATFAYFRILSQTFKYFFRSSDTGFKPYSSISDPIRDDRRRVPSARPVLEFRRSLPTSRSRSSSALQTRRHLHRQGRRGDEHLHRNQTWSQGKWRRPSMASQTFWW